MEESGPRRHHGIDTATNEARCADAGRAGAELSDRVIRKGASCRDLREGTPHHAKDGTKLPGVLAEDAAEDGSVWESPSPGSGRSRSASWRRGIRNSQARAVPPPGLGLGGIERRAGALAASCCPRVIRTVQYVCWPLARFTPPLPGRRRGTPPADCPSHRASPKAPGTSLRHPAVCTERLPPCNPSRTCCPL